MFEYLVYPGIFALGLGSYAAGAYVWRKRQINQKSQRTLNDFKYRMLKERVVNADLYESLAQSGDDLDYYMEQEERKYLERSARKFVECALSLMAHSYDNFERAKVDAYGILNETFSEDFDPEITIGKNDPDEEEEDDDEIK